VVRNLQDRPVLSPDQLGSVARIVLEREGARDGAVGIAFASDAEMSEFHRRFMDDASTTDVLSFPDDASDYWGDIIVCTDQALRQALVLDHPYPYELVVLVLHGMLHLLGYDHVVDRGEMTRLEEALRPRAAARGAAR
jgi:rRNA maturation RNase YbeY